MQELELALVRLGKVSWLFFLCLAVMCVFGGVLAKLFFHWGSPGRWASFQFLGCLLCRLP